MLGLWLAEALQRQGVVAERLTTSPASVRRSRRLAAATLLPDVRAETVDLAVRARLAHDPALLVWPLTERLALTIHDLDPPWAARLFPRWTPAQRSVYGSKVAMSRFAESIGVPVPRWREAADEDTMRACADALGYPLVLKGPGGVAGSQVEMVDAAEQLPGALDRLARRTPGPYTVQELVRGPTLAVDGLFDRGRAVRMRLFEKRVMHPPRTGPSTLIRTIDDPALAEHARRLFATLEVTGPAHADFVRHPDGTARFLEINPRPPGSLPSWSATGPDVIAPLALLLAGETPAADLACRIGVEHAHFPKNLMRRMRRGLLPAVAALLDPREWRGIAVLTPGARAEALAELATRSIRRLRPR